MLHPIAQPAFMRLTRRLHEAHDNLEITTWFNMFETYRSPQRQLDLYEQPNNGQAVVTKARPFESAHQFGLAADYVGVIRGPENRDEWSWDSSLDWDFIERIVRTEFEGELFMPVPEWDRGHVEHVAYLDLRTVFASHSK